EVRDIAYSGVLQGWNDYLENYNDGRGVIIIGHSQGTSHLARMIADEVDPDPAVRDQVISAILPGANVYVRKGQKVGGQFQNIPACEAGDQIGCVIAYSMFRNEPAPGASFGRVESGYWINPDPRPDPADFEVLCVNPGELSGDDGVLKLLANLPVFLGQPEGARPWLAHPDFYRADCMSAGTADWLNVANLNHPGDSRADLANLVDDGTGNLHLGDVNLALDNLVEVAGTEADAYLAREALRDERKAVSKKLSKKQKQLKKSKKKSRKLGKKAKKANRKCKAAKKSGVNAAAKCKAARRAKSKHAKAKKQVKKTSRQVKSLKKQLKAVDRKLG
ncbi:MAG: DUF3089 domain-containing protein, partial [Thermoleophilia bacterium]|nr:DUF3089 domain-containing protein [Thermoleophilia bacterium]